MTLLGSRPTAGHSRRRLLATVASAAGSLLTMRVSGFAAARGDGKAIAREALRYKGARYVWGGNTPRGFDCSGFTQYVVERAVGTPFSRVLEEQWQSGRRVGNGEWQAGDLVFFKNTYKRGLSHVGIYLGKGRFIHAQNEETGVVITDISAEYYASRYIGARRLV